MDVPAIKGVNPKTDEEEERHLQTIMQPFSALAFKIMTDPYVGRLSFFRVYSGHADHRFLRAQLREEPEGAHGPYSADARQSP